MGTNTNDKNGIFSSPCKECYKHSFSKEEPKGYYCAALTWDNRGTSGRDADKIRGECASQLIIKNA